MKLITFVFLILFLQINFAQINIDKPQEGNQYKPLYFYLNENMDFDNPFDLETNQIELHIIQPDYSRKIISFFYNGLNEDKIQQWEARFTPDQHGIYSFNFILEDKVTDQFNIPVEKNEEEKQGVLQLSGNYGLFQFESGEHFKGNGLNVCWADDYEYYFIKMKNAGINTTRIWLCPWNLSFEWQETGLGEYNLISAERLDGILELADKYGIYIILCMDYHGIAPKGVGYFKEDRWKENPYNKINGGPCNNEAELFTKDIARKFYKQKYKYIISRYGYSSKILAWEFFNEADLMAGTSTSVNRWHIEMAEYIKSIDTHNHLVSSSSTRNFVEKLVDAFNSPALDFVMYHEYNSLNIASYFIDLFDATIDYYKKPVAVGEFGIDFRGGERSYLMDSTSIGLHNGLWAGWFSQTPFIPLTWWWDSYIDKYNVWYEFENLSKFANEIDLNTDHLLYKTLTPGYSESKSDEQVPALVRCIYYSENCALWLKNLEYNWSEVYEGEVPVILPDFVQLIPDIKPGIYNVKWFNPQTGKFINDPVETEVKENGILFLNVPGFQKDLACIIAATN